MKTKLFAVGVLVIASLVGCAGHQQAAESDIR